MDGISEYNQQYSNKINHLIKENDILKDFYHYISYSASISTCYTYLSYISKFLNNINKPVEKLSFSDFNSFMSKFSTGNQKYTSSYRIVIYQSLKKFGDYLVAAEIISNNPMEKIPRPSLKESQETIMKREAGYLDYNSGEIKQYIENVLNEHGDSSWKIRNLSIIMIFISTGIRASALYKLDVSSINFEDGTLITTEKESKVVKKRLSKQVLKYLSLWIIEREKILNETQEDALFISNQKRRISNHAVSNIIKKYCYNINGKMLSPHKLRATYGTYLYDQTKDIYFVQQCMGHSMPKVTEKYIRGVKNKHESQSEAIMENLLTKI